MPDGAHATRAQMDAYNTTYQQWSTAASAAKDCRRNEATGLRTRASGLIQEFNSANARVDAANAYWTSWVNHLNGQSGPTQACAQQQHDIVAGEFHDRCSDETASTTAAPAAAEPTEASMGTGPLTPANSQSQCGAIAEAAHPPNTEHMSRGQMRTQVPAAVTGFNTWLQDAHAKLTCRHDEARNLGTQADALVTEYNTTSTLVASSATQWHTEVAEFNARSGH